MEQNLQLPVSIRKIIPTCCHRNKGEVEYIYIIHFHCRTNCKQPTYRCLSATRQATECRLWLHDDCSFHKLCSCIQVVFHFNINIQPKTTKCVLSRQLPCMCMLKPSVLLISLDLLILPRSIYKGKCWRDFTLHIFSFLKIGIACNFHQVR